MTILNNILAVSWHEFRVMCTRYSILLVLSGGIFVYGLLSNNHKDIYKMKTSSK